MSAIASISTATVGPTFIKRVNAAGGNTKRLLPLALNIKGSQMFMLDTNKLKIADLVMKWI